MNRAKKLTIEVTEFQARALIGILHYESQFILERAPDNLKETEEDAAFMRRVAVELMVFGSALREFARQNGWKTGLDMSRH